MWKSAEKSKIKDLNSPSNEPLIFLDCWSKNIEEDYNLRNPDNIDISEKSKTKDVTNVIHSMVRNFNSREQGTIGLQEKFIELENQRLKQSMCIDQLIQENI